MLRALITDVLRLGVESAQYQPVTFVMKNVSCSTGWV